MENTGAEFAPSLAAAAEKLLTQTLGGPVILGVAEVLREQYRNRVVRCPVIEGPSGIPASVIVKASVGEGEWAYDAEDDSPGSTASRFYNEWAGNLFLNAYSAETPLNARLLGGDRETGMFVLEDLGDGPSLADLVRGSDPAAAEDAFFRYARALGRMHAETAGHAEEWWRMRQAIGGSNQEREREGVSWLRENVIPFREVCAELDVPLALGFEDDVEAVRQTCDSPGPFDAFSPNDTCPDNHRLMTDGTFRFFDFEGANFRHSLLDAAYVRVPFPTCWCVNRLPEDLPSRLEDAYRVELIRGCSAARDDDLFYTSMSHACAYWTITTLSWRLKEDLTQDERWGIATTRQRHLYRLETLVETTSRYGHLPALTETANTLAKKLGSLWLPELELIPIYPAFRQELTFLPDSQ